MGTPLGRCGPLIAVAVAVALGAFAHPAAASYTYEQELFIAPDGQQTSESVACEDGTATSGGVSARSVFDDYVIVNTSAPGRTFGNDGWSVWVDNLVFGTGAPTNTPSVWAVCDAGAEQADYSYADLPGSLVVPDGGRGSAKLSCPPGQPVVGGGAYVAGNFADEQWLASSAPFDDEDQNDRPDDGWQVTVANDGDPGALAATVTPSVLCDATRKPSAYRYVSARREIATATQKGRYVACEEGRAVVGGGVKTPAGQQSTLINSSLPSSVSGPSGSTRGWTATVINGLGTAKMTVHAICRR